MSGHRMFHREIHSVFRHIASILAFVTLLAAGLITGLPVLPVLPVMANAIPLATTITPPVKPDSTINWNDESDDLVILGENEAARKLEIIQWTANDIVPGDHGDFTLTVRNGGSTAGVATIFLKAITFGADADGDGVISVAEELNGLGTQGSRKPDHYYDEITLSSKEHWHNADLAMLAPTSIEKLANDLAVVVDLANNTSEMEGAVSCISGKGCLLAREQLEPGADIQVALTIDFPFESTNNIANDLEDFPGFLHLYAEIVGEQLVDGLSSPLKVATSPNRVSRDGLITWDITALNAGLEPISPVTVTVMADALNPDTWTLHPARGTSVEWPPTLGRYPGNHLFNWNLGTLAPGQKVVLTITVPNSNLTDDGDICMTAIIFSPDLPVDGPRIWPISARTADLYDRPAHQMNNQSVNADTDQWDYNGWRPGTDSPETPVSAPGTIPDVPGASASPATRIGRLFTTGPSLTIMVFAIGAAILTVAKQLRARKGRT